MNRNDERKHLEQATSNLPEQALDSDAVALREGWRVLSAALEKNSDQFDEAAFLSKLQRDLAVPPIAVKANGRTGGWIVAAVLGGALAASLLLVVALSGGRFLQQPFAKPIPVTPEQNNLAVTQSEATPAEDYDGNNWTWDDPLDTQISVAAAQMQSFQKPALPLDASISTLNYQLQQMAQDLDEGAL